MDNRNDIDLRAAIPDTPDMCRQVVLQATGTYQEEKAMWRPSKMILAAALIVTLLCGTAYAIVNYYSVRDYVADGKTSAAFEENIIPLEKTVTSNGLSFTLGDAVFDGKDLAFTMHLQAAEGMSPMYVYPSIEAFQNDKPLETDFSGTRYISDLGLFIPNPNPEELLLGTGDQGVEATLSSAVAEGSVTWRYTVRIYKPLGELVQAGIWSDFASDELWMEHLRTLHQEGKIGVPNMSHIADYVNAVVPRGVGESFAERIEATGLFKLADTVVFEFTTAVPEKKLLTAAQTFPFEDFTLTVKSISQSFLQVDYELEVVFNEKQAHEHYVEQFYDIFDQNGVELKSRDATLSLAEDKLHCKVWGSVERISDEPLTSLTFVLDPVEWPEDKDIPTFTVDLIR